MPTEVKLRIRIEDFEQKDKIISAAASSLEIEKQNISGFLVLKKSLDARSKTLFFELLVKVFIYPEKAEESISLAPFEIGNQINCNKKVLIIGAGPAGLFAALRFIQSGFKPVIIERGKNVRDRRRDLAAINKNGIVNPDSNYCFGEGGAGTYSDGKLYTRSNKRGNVRQVMEWFVHYGADENILVEAHPHIGTNKLPKIIENIRNKIIEHGGEFLFQHRLTDFTLTSGKINEVVLENLINQSKTCFKCDAMLLATGHSARDIYLLLHSKNILLECKPFALGVRIEHPQETIDAIQYKCSSKTDLNFKRSFLPAAAYSWVQHYGKKDIYSFCMCPGGIIAPCATSQTEIVTNGWSPSKRNNPFANSGLVVSVDEIDFKPFEKHGVLKGMEFQKSIEHAAWEIAGKTQTAPAQRAIDFVNGKLSVSLPDCSYRPGIVSTDLKLIFPENISTAIKNALLQQEKKMKGYLCEDALLVATESRTSTPVRIPRNAETGFHPQVENLFPCGEGAGYAGGIVSAAIDGINQAEKIIMQFIS